MQIPVQGNLFVDSADLPGANNPPLPTLHTTRPNTELTDRIAVADSGIHIVPKAIWEIPLGALTTGQRLRISAEAQVSNDLNYNVGTVSGVILTDYAGMPATDGNDYGGVYATDVLRPCAFQGTNIDKTIHHTTFNRTAIFEMPQDMAQAHLKLIGWAVSSSAPNPPGSHVIWVDQDYGHLDVEVI